MAVPLDDYPIHQTPLSMAYVATSDRNFYDRYYLCGFANDGSTCSSPGSACTGTWASSTRS